MAKTEPRRSKKETKTRTTKNWGNIVAYCMLYVDFDDLYLFFFKRAFFWRGWGGWGGVDVWNA